MRKINAAGEESIKRWEALRLKAYLDSGGVPTIGWGHVKGVKMGMTITEAQAQSYFEDDIAQFERVVDENVRVSLTDNQFAALVSFAYNVGAGAFLKSTLLKKLNAGDFDSVPAELGKWVNVKGKRVQGLVNRRAAEAGLWAKGEYVTGRTVPAAPAAPKVLTPENIAAGSGVASSIATAASSPGPLQWAFAAIMVIGFAVALWYFLIRRKEASA